MSNNGNNNRRATSVRYPDDILRRAEALSEKYRANPPAFLGPRRTCTRSDVILVAIEHGLEQLEREAVSP